MYQSLTKYIPTKILAAYRVGSKIYGLDTDSSDDDIIVIADGINGPAVVKDAGLDLFVFDDSYFEKLCNLDEKTMSYFAIWMDNTLLAKENLIYLDEEYKERFESLIGIDWGKHLYSWLKRVIDYFKIRLEEEHKPLYHLFRIRSEVEYYLENHKFEPHISDADRELSLAFKANPKEHFKDVREAFSYVERVYEEGAK